MSRILDMAKRFVTDPQIRFGYLNRLGVYNRLSDETFLKYSYRIHMGTELDLEDPKSFNEKLQWLKLHNRRPEYTTMADKYEMRAWVEERVGPGHTVPVLGVWDDPEEIDFDSLPDQFVLKCNHNSGLGMYICRDKAKLDKEKAIQGLRKGLKQNYYLSCREWPYKDVKRRVIAEEYLKNGDDKDLTDYKFFCFQGEPKVMYITKENSGLPGMDFFDMDFNHLDLCMEDRPAEVLPEKPEQFDKMKEIAARLSAGVPQLRVDFYLVEDHIYVGELTFFHGGGMTKITPEYWADRFSEWLVLPEKK